MTISNGYCTLESLKQTLNIPSTDGTDDTPLELAVEAASRHIDGHVGAGRKFWQDATVVSRSYFPSQTERVYVDDISTLTGLIVKVDENDDGTFETTLTINTDFIVEPVNAAAEFPVRPWESIRLLGGALTSFPALSSGRPSVQVTAKFGWSAVPDAVERACVLQAKQAFKARDATYGAFQFGDDGTPLRVPVLDPTARVLLETFIRYTEVDNGV